MQRLLLSAVWVPLALSYVAAGVWERGWIDTVIAFRPGAGQDFGREYFPHNIFGPPDTAARADRPSANPRQILSLGMGGEIVVGFKGRTVVNGPGADFVIFENAFQTPTGKVFIEPAVVSVSRDGLHWYSFSWDSTTLEGCAGRTPTHSDVSDLLDPTQSGGDWFDLDILGVDSIRYIRITDITGWLASRPWHPLWDPTLSGFDLDAVGSRYLVRRGHDAQHCHRGRYFVLAEPCIPAEWLGAIEGMQYRFYSIDGRLATMGRVSGWICIPYRNAVLLLQIVGGEACLVVWQ